jgi:hypothetical protein
MLQQGWLSLFFVYNIKNYEAKNVEEKSIQRSRSAISKFSFTQWALQSSLTKGNKIIGT